MATSEPQGGSAARYCVFCGEQMGAWSLICKDCGNFQPPIQIARLQAHWSMTLVRTVSIGAIIAFGVTLYSQHSATVEREHDRLRALAHGMLSLQSTSEELRQPCVLKTASDCIKRVYDLATAFGSANYEFKEGTRYLFDKDDPIQHAIDFIDDFYNPGQPDLARKEPPLAELQAAPLQEAILRSREDLAEPFLDSRWCTVPRRQAMRSLTLSIDIYRYCASVIRDIASTRAAGGDDKARRKGASYETCVTEEPTVTKANKIYDKLSRLDDLNHSAPWLFDTYCAAAGLSIRGGPVPTVTRQLVVVSTEGWNSTEGALTRYSRPDGEAPWKREGESTKVMLGKNGIAWGRGVWTGPVTPGQPVKVEGDGRAPVGLFEIGPAYSEAPVRNAKLSVLATTNAMYCEDDPRSSAYNTTAVMTQDRQQRCSRDKSQCPSELLRRPDGVYKRFVWIHHNDSPAVVKGAGSCIFLHLDHSPPRPTAGCTTVSDSAMDQLLGWLDPEARPMLLQVPRDELARVVRLP